jgi:hypothetical protein
MLSLNRNPTASRIAAATRGSITNLGRYFYWLHRRSTKSSWQKCHSHGCGHIFKIGPLHSFESPLHNSFYSQRILLWCGQIAWVPNLDCQRSWPSVHRSYLEGPLQASRSQIMHEYNNSSTNGWSIISCQENNCYVPQVYHWWSTLCMARLATLGRILLQH